jgi:probable phosphoglycerate mutase
MDVTRIIAIRHGETDWNVATRIQGSTDIALNTKGHWQAARVADALREEHIDAVYSSDLSRAFTTASAIAAHHGQAVRTDAGLRERRFGHFEGLSWHEIETQYPDDAVAWRSRVPTFLPSGGESLIMLRERVQATLQAIAARHLGEHIVIATHGGVLDAIYRLATGQSLDAPRSWHLGNAAINRLLWTPDALTLVSWGEQVHLESDTDSGAE